MHPPPAPKGVTALSACQRDRFFTAPEALTYGLIDAIMPEPGRLAQHHVLLPS